MKNLILLSTIGLLLTTGCTTTEIFPDPQPDYLPDEFYVEDYPTIPDYINKPMYTDPYWFLNPIKRHFRIKYQFENDN